MRFPFLGRWRKAAPRLQPVRRDAAFSIELPQHRLQYLPGGGTLVVSFDNASRPVSEPYEGRHTWGQPFYTGLGHSLMGVIARRNDWYRDRDLIAGLEELRDQGFFASFDRVVLTGGSMGGFAALAFAPLAPGCIVIAFSPQTTLRRDLVPWEPRYPEGKRQDWTLPYSEAADGVAAAGLAYVLYDNLLGPDRRQAMRLRASPQVRHLRLPAGGHAGTPALNQMKLLRDVTCAMIAGTLDEPQFRRLARRRRGIVLYRQNLIALALERGHPRLARRVLDLSGSILPPDEVQRLRGQVEAALAGR